MSQLTQVLDYLHHPVVKREPPEQEDIHDDATVGDVLNRIEPQESDNYYDAANDRMVSDAIGNIQNLGRKLRLSRYRVQDTEEALESVVKFQAESRHKMKEIAEKERHASSMANNQVAKMISHTEKLYKTLKSMTEEMQVLKKSNAYLSDNLENTKADVAKLSGENQKLSASVKTFQQEAINLKNDLSLLSYEKGQAEAALMLACDLKVVEEGERETLKRMGELDRAMTASAERKFQLQMRLARARARANCPPPLIPIE